MKRKSIERGEYAAYVSPSVRMTDLALERGLCGSDDPNNTEPFEWDTDETHI